MRRFLSFSILAFFAFLVAAPEVAFAEGGIKWINYPQGVPVCIASGNQQNMRMAPDGSGGAIIVWEDYRYPPQRIYAQRIDKDGNRLWAQDGIAVTVSTPSYKQEKPVIVSDGSGGAIIAWEDYRTGNSNIYALREKSIGVTYPGWTANGVLISTGAMMSAVSPDIASDGYGGAVIVWQEKYSDLTWKVFARWINMDGTLKWLVVVSSGTADFQANPKIINDGQGYVITTWEEIRGNNNIYAQRIEINTGSINWDVNGTTVTMAVGGPKKPQIVPDGSGGAIIVWTDYRPIVDGTAPDIYAQRIDFNGNPVWPDNGIPVCKKEGEQGNPVIINDLLDGATMGAIIAWEDRTDNGDIYAEKVPLSVGPDWTGGGKAMATGKQMQICPRLVSDNQGGGIITWIENDIVNNQYEIFASKRNQDGDPVWSYYPGLLVYKGTEVKDHQIVSDGSLGVIIAWQSGPSTDYNIYAQRVIDDAVMPLSASISGRVTLSDGKNGITGIEVWALQDDKLISSCITDTKGYYGIVGLLPGSVYLVRANWMVNDIEFSVSKEASAPSYSFDFTLEKDYLLGTIAGNVIGVEGKYIASLSCPQAKRISGTGLQKMLSPGNGIAFVELEQRGKVVVRVPVETDGNYSIPNLLPGRFVARAYNGSIYSNPRMVNLKEGETLRVDFAFGIMPEERVFNYPNPAKSGSTAITYYCGYTDPEAEIRIYNMSGELVRKVKDSEIDKAGAPIYNFLWDCKNSSRKDVASGVYIYAVEVKEKSSGETKKVIKRMAVIR